MNNAQSLALNVLFPEEITHQIMSRKKKKKKSRDATEKRVIRI